jgi:hypothetical protein
MAIRVGEGAGSVSMSSQGDPTISLTPNPANPGSFVEVNGSGFPMDYRLLLIRARSSTLFQGERDCFPEFGGNITGIFQVSTNASGFYVIVVTEYGYNYPSAVNQTTSLTVNPLTPPPTQPVTTTVVSTFVSTSLATTTQISTSTTIQEIRSDLTMLQAVLTASAAAAVTASLGYLHTNLRMARLGRMKHPDLAFDVEVRSGIEREKGTS